LKRNSGNEDGFGRGGEIKGEVSSEDISDIIRPGNVVEYLGNDCIELVALISLLFLPEFEKMKLGSLCLSHSSPHLA